jgi:hypothetical protein
MMRFKIVVMREAGHNHGIPPTTLIVMDEATLEAGDTADAARTYAALFAGHYHDPQGTYDYCADPGCPRLKKDKP